MKHLPSIKAICKAHCSWKKVKNDGWQAICLFSKLLFIQQQGQKTSAITSISETPRNFARLPKETPATMHHCQRKRWKNPNANKVMTERNLYYQHTSVHLWQELPECDHGKTLWSNLQQLPGLFSAIYSAITFLLGWWNESLIHIFSRQNREKHHVSTFNHGVFVSSKKNENIKTIF